MVAVYIRTASLPPADGNALARFGALLDAAEAARAARFLRAVNRDEFTAAHGVKRLLLGELLGADPRSLRFRVDATGGKPALDRAGGPDLRFNLSHTSGLVACAAAFGVEVGIDVEPCGRRVEPALADQYFAPDEAAWLARQDSDRRDEAFMALWTLKEAVIKAVGRGLSLGLSTFSVRPDPPLLLHHDGAIPAGTHCALRQWRAGGGHFAALAALVPEGEEVEIVAG